MNIAYFTTGLRNKGGFERIIIDKANALVRRDGMNVHIVCMQGRDSDPVAYPVDPGVRIANLGIIFDPGHTSARKKPLAFFLKWFRWRRCISRAVRKFVRDNNIDITVSSTYDVAAPYITGITHHVLESHAYRHLTPQPSLMPVLRRWFTRRAVRKADAVVAITEADAHLWTEARRVATIGNFTEITPTLPYNPSTRRVMAAGRLDPQKGFDILINAWRIVARKHPDWALDIYGADTWGYGNEVTLQSQINEAGLSHCITLCGVETDMPEVYGAHSLFVLSSRFEGFGLVLLEAMACGLPSVSFDCPYGPADIIGSSEGGVLVPFHGMNDCERAEALGTALCSVIEKSPEELIEMSEAAMRQAATFNRDAIIDQWVDLFNSLK